MSSARRRAHLAIVGVVGLGGVVGGGTITIGSAHAERDPARLLAPLVCQVADIDRRLADSRDGRGYSPLRDRDLREWRELGGAKRIRGSEVEHYVAFTFDDGPRLITTPAVLDALDRYDVPATFFAVGWRVAGDRDSDHQRAALLREIRDRGHLIGNHTFSHRRLTEITTAQMRAQIDRSTAALQAAVGYTPHLFRPPYGAMTPPARKHLAREGFTEVRWNIDTLDFRADLARTLRERTLADILGEDGGVVLMHDTKEATAETIAGILDDLERENCRRLTAQEPPIIPVSLHYFVRERDGTARAVPPEAAARTARYRDALPARCAARKRLERRGDPTSAVIDKSDDPH